MIDLNNIDKINQLTLAKFFFLYSMRDNKHYTNLCIRLIHTERCLFCKEYFPECKNCLIEKFSYESYNFSLCDFLYSEIERNPKEVLIKLSHTLNKVKMYLYEQEKANEVID